MKVVELVEAHGKRRKARGHPSVIDHTKMIAQHFPPFLLETEVAEVSGPMVRDAVLELCDRNRLAPNSLHVLVERLHAAFEDAVFEGLCNGNPVVLRRLREEMPAKAPLEVTYRDDNRFIARELEALWYDRRIPIWRRATYVGAYFTGARISEVVALYTRAIRSDRVIVAEQWDHADRRTRPTKTRAVKQVPLRADFATWLSWWVVDGQAIAFGKPDWRERVFPRAGVGNIPQHNNRVLAWKAINADCHMLKMPHRSPHAFRHSLLTDAVEAGAPKDVIKLVTHMPRMTTEDNYLASQAMWPQIRAAYDLVPMHAPDPAAFAAGRAA